MNRRAWLLAGCGGVLSVAGAALGQPPLPVNLGLLLYSYGIRANAEKQRGFADPVRFAEFARERGATAVQLPLGIRDDTEAASVRRRLEALKMHVEGIVAPPKEEQADRERFAAELQTARACGATVARIVMLGGRRYEVFTRSEEYVAFAARAQAVLERAEPVARDKQVVLAVENHKDFRVDELVDLLKRVSSEWIGICLDTGNNLALLDEPHAVVEALAPFTRTVHLKDIGVEESVDGFLMAEVPLGQGYFDLPRMVSTIRKASPHARMNLEMITRDPLSIPCLTEKYWATLARTPGSDLARTLATIRRSTRAQRLPRMTGLQLVEQLAAEDRHVRESFQYAARSGLLAP